MDQQQTASEDQLKADFTMVNGPRPTGSTSKFRGVALQSARDAWDQNLRLFRGIVPMPAEEGQFRGSAFTAMAGEAEKYGLGLQPIFFRMQVRGKQAPLYDLWVSYVDKIMPDNASQPGQTRFQVENLADVGVNATVIINEQNEWRIKEGECLNPTHPQLQIPLLNQNAINCGPQD